jgi:hypothetical protein
MSQISPPIRILLVSAVAFMAAWMLFLRPKDDAGAPAPSTPAPTASSRPVDAGGEKATSLAGKAVEKANEATAAQDAQAEQLAGGAGETAAEPAATAPSTSATTAATKQEKGTQPGAVSKSDAVASGLPVRVLHALGSKKVVALLFWSPKSPEDRDVRKALNNIDRHHGKVLAEAAHIKRIARFQQITRGAAVTQSPTVVIIDRNRKVETLVGFVDRRSIDQAVTDALRNS